MKKLLALYSCFIFFISVSAQPVSIKRIDPSNWWVGMKYNKVQLLVYGPGAGSLTYSINYPGVQLVKAHRVENANYAFLDVTIASTAKAGTLMVTGS